MSRLRKFKSKYRGMWLTTKIVMIWYLLLFTGTYFTSNTSAVFSSKVEPKGSIEAADWLKGQYELEFEMSGTPHRTCIIDTFVKNIGPGDMTENVKFDIFFVKNGNPLKGDKVGEGQINALESGDVVKVSYEANKTGKYVFIVNGKDKKVESKKFNVECNLKEERSTNPEVKTEENINTNKEENEKVIENIEQQQVEKENKKESTQPKSVETKQRDEQVEVKEEKTEKSIELEHNTEKSFEQKPVETQKPVKEQKPVEEQKQNKAETKPEVESNPEQENKEGEE
jgi:YqxM protein